MEFTKDDFCNYKTVFNHVFWPRFYMMREKDYTPDEKGFPWFWKYRILNWLYRFFDSIREYCFRFGPFTHWDAGVSPSFPDAIGDIWDNLMLALTPWYRVRRKFMLGFVNLNGCKLLHHNRSHAYVRTRGNECVYYELIFTTFRYKLIKSQLFKKGDSKPRNQFIEAIGFIGRLDEELEELSRQYEERISTVCTGWVFGWKSAVRELNKVAYLTQTLGWISTNKEEVDND